MMAYYWYNNNTDAHGNHEVHNSNCNYMPNIRNASFIGEYQFDFQAMEAVRHYHPYKKFDGCKFCMPTEHTS